MYSFFDILLLNTTLSIQLICFSFNTHIGYRYRTVKDVKRTDQTAWAQSDCQHRLDHSLAEGCKIN